MYQHLSAFQSRLQREGAAAAFLRFPENLVLFSQYWPRYGFSFLLIPADGAPTLLCPQVEVEDAEAVGLEHVIGFGDVLLSDGDPFETLVSLLRRLRAEMKIPDGARIAVELGEDVMAPSFVANKVQLAGDATRRIVTAGFQTEDLVPVREAIREVRSVKSESDLEKLQMVNEILQKSLDYFETLLERPGIREIDVLAETECYFSKLACGYRGIRGVSRPFGQLSTGPERSLVAWADGIVSCGRPLQQGDVAMYEIGACVDGYWADLTRTGCVGGFQGQKRILHEIVQGAFDAGLAAARDGALGCEVDEACRAYITRCGYGAYFVHAAGHGTGFAHSEGFPHLEPGSRDVLRTNMVVAIEPGVYVPGIGGIRIEENVVVGAHGGRILGKP